MNSPARKHYTSKLAQTQADASAQSAQESRSEYERMLLLLDTHQQQLSQIQSVKRKIAAKATLLPEYEAYLDGVVTAEQSAQDNVLTTLMVWHMDCGNLARALQLAECALLNDMVMPERYKRTIGCVVAEQAAECEVSEADQPQRLHLLQKAMTLTKDQDMPDEVRAKLHKASGQAHEQAGDPGEALASLESALALHSGVGVKKDIERLRRQIKQQQDSNKPAV